MSGFGPSGCLDETLQAARDILRTADTLDSAIVDPAAFVNPELDSILSLADAGNVPAGQTLSHIINLGSSGVGVDNLITLNNTIVDFVGGTRVVPVGEGGSTWIPGQSPETIPIIRSGTALGDYESWTEFTSGRLPGLPEFNNSALNSAGGAIAAAGIAGFGLMAIAKGDQSMKNAMCDLSAEEPCGPINAIFGAVLGLFRAAMEGFIVGFNAMVDILNKALEYLAIVQDMISQMIGWVLDGINAVVGAIFEGIRYALAKLLKLGVDDPCLRAVLDKIGSPNLKTALGIQNV